MRKRKRWVFMTTLGITFILLLAGVATCAGGKVEVRARFTAFPTSGECPLTVQFTDQSTGEITHWEWDFDGDGVYDWSSGTAGSMTHVYGAAGTYTAVLRVTDNEGAVDTDTRVISVSQAPTAEFETSSLEVSPAEAMPGEPVAVEADVTNVGGVEGSYSATLTVNGEMVAVRNVTVAAGATETVSFSYSTDVAGVYAIELDGLSSMLEVVVPDVVVVSSNVFVYESSMLIDGESRRLCTVAEVRNDYSREVRVTSANVYFYDADSNVVCKRYVPLSGCILNPGDVIALRETVPSVAYYSTETNDFPENWTTYEIILSLDYYDPSELRPVELAVQDVEATLDEYGKLIITGSVLNIDQESADHHYVKACAILYASDGSIINAKSEWPCDEPLQPGQSQPFEISFSSFEPLDYASYTVKAFGTNQL